MNGWGRRQKNNDQIERLYSHLVNNLTEGYRLDDQRVVFLAGKDPTSSHCWCGKQAHRVFNAGDMMLRVRSPLGEVNRITIMIKATYLSHNHMIERHLVVCAKRCCCANGVIRLLMLVEG